MRADFEWASYPRLIEHSFFHRTMMLYQLENVLKTPILDSLHWTRRFEYPWIMEKLDATGKILDVGAGATALQFAIANTAEVISADVDLAAIDWVNSRRNDQLVKNPKCILGGLPNLPFPSNEFGTVLCISVLEHLPKDQVLSSINELIRVCNKGVLITMDIALGKPHPKQTDVEDLCQITRVLGFACPPPPKNTLTFTMEDYTFGVACLQLRKTN